MNIYDDIDINHQLNSFSDQEEINQIRWLSNKLSGVVKYQKKCDDDLSSWITTNKQ
jgi:hypothetical protein